MSAPFSPGQTDYFDKLNEMSAGVDLAIEVGEGAAGAAASATASASDAAAAKAASDAAAAIALSASQAAASDAASAQILVDAVPPTPFPTEMPWAVADQYGQPILGVRADGTAHAVLDRLPGLDMLDGVFKNAVCDEQGYLLWGIRWDGTVYSAGQPQSSIMRAMVVRGDLWAITADALPVQVTEALEVVDPGVTGADISYLARIGGGLIPATASIPASDGWAPFVTRVLHVLGSGQSLSMGYLSEVSSINPQCANRLRTLAGGVDTVDQGSTHVLTAAECVPTRPLTANTQEAPLVQHVAHLQRLQAIPHGAGIVASLHGWNARTVLELSKGSVYYGNLITAATNVRADTVAGGRSYHVPYVDWIQGENDRTSLPGVYTAALAQLQTDLDTDLRAISGQSSVIPMLIDQISNWTAYNIPTSNVPLEQLEIARQYPRRFYCAGPKYWLETVDKIHLASLNSRRLAAMHARVGSAAMQGIEWLPTHCVSAARSGAVITLKFHTPDGRLVADTMNVSDPGNLGIRWADDTSSASVIGVLVNLDNTVTVTLSAAPTGANGYIGIADVGVSGAAGGPTSGPRACLRDSSADLCGDSLPLYNWACHQRININ